MKKGMIITAVVVAMGMSVPTGVMAADAMETSSAVQQEVTYEKIEIETLPEAVVKSVSEGYADYSVSEAFQGSDGSYKVVLEKDNEKIAVFFNDQGEFLKVEKADDAEE
ncbi:hypothetical protein [Sunxiuqinia elliptica]|uniref:Beta-lactamase-inhibitor-like PepSY-like domain-containing protein n=1 Tax=Sunxiuqinia elliptica TaxID=655355 RepID=A0A4R6GRI9_9BACT|nr:hypothetical protein [Sunxiuqinia elliptica]TDN97155.1 hypothetical protein DET52_11072 [Sunxiuqinia elliptica]TDO60660.1 hypothetical protein DET65_2472 [Sunxiuqinia elliptica]